MTLDQFIAALQQLRADQPNLANKTVELPWDPGYTTIGGHPAVKLTGVAAGFDWDHGRVFVSTAERVGQVPDELRRRLRIHEDIQTGIALTVRRGESDPGQALKRIQGYLDASGDRLKRVDARVATDVQKP